MKNIFILLFLSLALFSCEDKVDISKQLSSGKVAIAVDAFINDMPESQVIKLNTTQYYFDNSGLKSADGAVVNLVDLTTQTTYPFVEKESGAYYSTTKGDVMLKLDHDYQLLIVYKNETFVAYSKLNRVVPIDSIKFEASKTPEGIEIEGKYTAEFFANDEPGVGDRYFVRYYKNGVRSLKPAAVGLGYDASAFPNGITDGKVFDVPLRRFSINENGADKQWIIGDKIKIEIYSITEETSKFLSQVVTQTTISDGGPLAPLFSPPPANVPTNIKNITSVENKAVGFFCTCAAKSAETVTPTPLLVKP